MADVITDTIATLGLADLTKPAATATTVTPKLTKAKVEATVPLLVYVEKNNGYGGISRTTGVAVGDVKLIHKAMQARIAELGLKDVEEIEKPVESVKVKEIIK